VRAALFAGRLDPRMLTGHDPAALLALLDPGRRDTVGPPGDHLRAEHAVEVPPGCERPA
jgi:hypothetical protein